MRRDRLQPQLDLDLLVSCVFTQLGQGEGLTQGLPHELHRVGVPCTSAVTGPDSRPVGTAAPSGASSVSKVPVHTVG